MISKDNICTYGLILAGGKSARMGTPKHLISYHDAPQYLYLYKLLSNFCDEVYISCNADQAAKLSSHVKAIIDKNDHEGPLAGIKNAFEIYKANWLIVPCDMPNVSHETLTKLTTQTEDKLIQCAVDDQNILNPLLAFYSLENTNTLSKYDNQSATNYVREAGFFPVKLSRKESINVNSKEEYENFLSTYG